MSTHPYDDDEISLISMRELAPSPIDDCEIETTLNSSGSERCSPPTNYPPTSPRSLAFWLIRSQKLTSYAFLTFLTTHVASTAITPLLFGVDAGNSSLLLVRTYIYAPTPLVEALLVPASLALHIASGLSLRVYRHYLQKSRYGGQAPLSLSSFRWRNLSGVARSGWIAVPLVTAHSILMRGIPLSVDGDSSQVNLEYAAWGFLGYGMLGRTVATMFYTGLIGAVSWHVIFGLAEYWKVGIRKKKRSIGATVAVATLCGAGLSRVVFQGKISGYMSRHYANLYALFFSRALGWMRM